MTNYQRINDLPEDHPFRNTPLLSLGARYKWRESQGTIWKYVMPNYAIAHSNFNQLGDAWTQFDIWEVECDPDCSSK